MQLAMFATFRQGSELLSGVSGELDRSGNLKCKPWECITGNAEDAVWTLANCVTDNIQRTFRNGFLGIKGFFSGVGVHHFIPRISSCQAVFGEQQSACSKTIHV